MITDELTNDGNSDRLLSSSPNADGGPGSGNFGHAGRPGEVGGSAETHRAINTSPKPTLKYSSREEYFSAQRDAYSHYLKKIRNIDIDKQTAKDEYDSSRRSAESEAASISSNSSIGDFDKKVALARVKADEIEAENRFILAASKAEQETLSAIDEYNSSYDPYYEFSAISGSHSIESDSSVDVINPNHLDMNCQRCAVALEYRRRGYNVSASDGEDDELADGRLISVWIRTVMIITTLSSPLFSSNAKRKNTETALVQFFLHGMNMDKDKPSTLKCAMESSFPLICNAELLSRMTEYSILMEKLLSGLVLHLAQL